MKKSSWIRHLQIAILLFLAISSVAFASENLTAHFIDVGQGDSILLQFDGKNVLIDGGIQEMGPRVETYLRNHGVSSLDLLVATHPHEDHIGGLITILKDFSIKQVLDSGQPDSSQVYETFLTLIDQKNILYKVAQRGQKINLDTNLKIDVLSPPPTLFSNDLNQNSIVLKVTYNKVSFLLMGDAGFEAENSIKAAGYDLKSDILKVGHHGSSSASGTAFLAKVKPAISIIEVGTGNDYGHPTQKTLNALQSIGSEIYRTDTNGNIVITTDGTSYSISSQKLSAVPASTTSQTKTSAYTPTVTQASSPITTPSSTVSGGPFVGSSKSDKYQYPSCSAAKKIKPANLVTFSSSADARARGYVPCGICHPP
jgi:beta-lactamase superfamily II metal-dependent hydrolase